jgi:hypothetical protein
MAQREKKGYALKRERGLVPHFYNTSAKEFQAGAWRNWPARIDDAERAALGRRETQPRESWHRFVGTGR